MIDVFMCDVCSCIYASLPLSLFWLFFSGEYDGFISAVPFEESKHLLRAGGSLSIIKDLECYCCCCHQTGQIVSFRFLTELSYMSGPKITCRSSSWGWRIEWDSRTPSRGGAARGVAVVASWWMSWLFLLSSSFLRPKGQHLVELVFWHLAG